MKLFLQKILDRFFVVFGAFLFFQFPLFIHQYQQQLIGHVYELEWQVVTMRDAASKSEKSLDQYVKKFLNHPDPDFSRQGMVMNRILTRWEKLTTSLLRLQQASILTRPFMFLRYLQWDIFKSTAETFQPGISFTLEGLVYALLGMINGYLLFHLLGLFLKKIVQIKRILSNN